MTGYSVIMGPQGRNEYAAGGRDVAQEGFLRHLRCRTARVLQDIVDSDLRASNTDSPKIRHLKIRRARVLQEIVESDLRASNPRRARCGAGG